MPFKLQDTKESKFTLSKVNSTKRVRVQPKDNIQLVTDGKVITCALINFTFIIFTFELRILYFYILNTLQTNLRMLYF